MQREIIQTDKAPAAIGPYAQANVIGGHLIFTSGQLALDPQTNQMVGRTVAEQTEQVIANLQAIIEASGATLADVVKTTVYLTDLGCFDEFNAEYAKHFFGDKLPSRTTVEVSELPRGGMVEIEAIAVVPQ
jgi:2-iminobutanoate/2-iminopropanoate deaminase